MHESDFTTTFAFTNLKNIAGFMFYQCRLTFSVGTLDIRDINFSPSSTTKWWVNPNRNISMIMGLRTLTGFSFEQPIPEKVNEVPFFHFHFRYEY